MGAVVNLIKKSQVGAEEQNKLRERAAEIFHTLFDSHIVEKWELDDGSMDYTLTIDMPEDLALDQPLSPFPYCCFRVTRP